VGKIYEGEISYDDGVGNGISVSMTSTGFG